MQEKAISEALGFKALPKPAAGSGGAWPSPWADRATVWSDLPLQWRGQGQPFLNLHQAFKGHWGILPAASQPSAGQAKGRLVARRRLTWTSGSSVPPTQFGLFPTLVPLTLWQAVL